jgi:hypothetical protein
VAEAPFVKRYALVQNDSNNGVRRFHLARVASARAVPDAQRLERMEDVAAREHSPQGEGSDPLSRGDSGGLTP